MAQASPQSESGVSPLKNLVVYTSQTPGLEKTLRLIQATAQVIGFSTDNRALATQCLTARDQLALGRRYFRLLDFYGCFERVHYLMSTPSSSGTILAVMELAQYTFLGLYLFLENFTILHDMNVARVNWYKPLMTEANKFWFYALSLSIMRCFWELLFPTVSTIPAKISEKDSSSGKGKGKGKGKAQTQQVTPPKWPLIKRIIIDGCDLTLPGSFIGWVPASGLQIGIGMVVSTLLAGHEVWLRQQR
ncbi:PEX11 domain protein [Aspergillus stella-maris]|uniref:PEX11 domain protein n=1 Tax=Aspergillus stella-maris TaxID=1810926 RepID=UPI003CCCAEAC